MSWRTLINRKIKDLRARLQKLQSKRARPAEIFDVLLELAKLEDGLCDKAAMEHLQQASRLAQDLSIPLAKHAHLSWMQAEVLLRQGDSAGALRRMHEAVMLAEQSLTDGTQWMFTSLYIQELLLAGHLDDAREWLARRSIPEAWTDALYLLELCIERRWKDLNELIPHVCESTRSAPQDIQAIVLFGFAKLFLAGDCPSDALAPATRAVQWAREAGSLTLQRWAEAALAEAIEGRAS